VTCVIRNPPVGLGEPVFDKLEAQLAHAMLSIPATKGFEIGSGFQGALVAGSRHNDPFVQKPGGGLKTATNKSGGVQGGISNGEHIYFRVAFKSPATISQEQKTAQYDGTSGALATRGRHDPVVVNRAVPIVEAMAALVIMEYVRSSVREHALTRKQLVPDPKRPSGGGLPSAAPHLPAALDARQRAQASRKGRARRVHLMIHAIARHTNARPAPTRPA
jgi:chorismate synthase